MRRFSIILGTLALGFISCQETNSSDIKVVSPEEMKSLIEMDEVQLVDVRTEAEYRLEHIAKSQNIDVRSPNFDEEIQKLDKDRPVIVYCRSGIRSAKCVAKLKDAGFVKIYDLNGGIAKWKYKGLEVETKS
ncbi:MAG: rhodanese-like domain-containing protein [Bacteroidia bacterium]|nr:rhodanese-like domain-containing protein [Bacteroidia bacterium]MBT8309192.1 rhodanese-like domain-containing protein [Bacteroidia bacterium]NND11830.1 rhodanese-like domain-containing protein [Flavobacteriaceae bacterium]NNK27241.1 rhodanese-like domain-containing protein [Flavobacteriaceae bacterium]NNL59925.1 rhodanese-like domain-containing protein [Flavobacteriaceae bacterium]